MIESFAYLVVVDISGYTKFITERSLTLAHAEQIITDLISAVIDASYHPLILNKLEGDAALLYRLLESDDVAAARDVMAQVRTFFPAFHTCVARLSEMRRNCNCDACTNIKNLKLKAFVHAGDILLKRVRQFDELAGEPVIFLHRLMKNTVQSREYVLITQEAARHAQLDASTLASHHQSVESFGAHDLWVVAAEKLPASAQSAPLIHGKNTPSKSTNVYRHLPVPPTGLMTRIRHWLVGIKK